MPIKAPNTAAPQPEATLQTDWAVFDSPAAAPAAHAESQTPDAPGHTMEHLINQPAGLQRAANLIQAAALNASSPANTLTAGSSAVTVVLGGNIDENLYHAALHGNTYAVSVLLATGLINNVNQGFGKDGKTALNAAAQNGHTEIVKTLLALRGINVNDGSLRAAAQNGHTEIVKTLLAVDGIDVNKADKHGVTPLDTAARTGRTEIVKALLAVDGIRVKDDSLYYAIYKGDTELAKALLAVDGIKVNDNILFSAAEKGQTKIVKALLAVDGIKVNDSSLRAAARFGHTETVKALLAVDGVAVKGAAGGTALHDAAQYGHTEIVKALLAAKTINATAKDNAGKTALDLASANGQLDTVVALLGANGVNWKKTKFPNAGLRHAAKLARTAGHEDVAKILKSVDKVQQGPGLLAQARGVVNKISAHIPRPSRGEGYEHLHED